MGWKNYSLDIEAQKLVLAAKKSDASVSDKNKKSLNQAFKMREAVAYGLERFWGEHLRLKEKESNKSNYWKATWDAFVEIMAKTHTTIPNDKIDSKDADSVQKMAEQLWNLDLDTHRVALVVLTQLCDCMVWWTQRYK